MSFLLNVAWLQAAEISPFLANPPSFLTEERISIILTLNSEPTDFHWKRMQEYDFSVHVHSNKKRSVLGRSVSGNINVKDIPIFAELDFIDRIDLAKPLWGYPSLNKTQEAIEASTLWFSSNSLQGKGLLIAAQEFVGQGWDIFHPDFFRPDGGYYSFSDTDEDLILGVGDKVDLDRDGVFESDISLMGAQDGFEIDVDWFFIDENQNGVRDFGASYGEEALAYGEPIFVGDDLNGNGQLDIGEKLIRLGSSKFRAIHQNGVIYRRGINLIEYDPQSIDPGHGTGAMGIAGAGWPLLRRYTGIAPQADLLGITDEDHLRALSIAQEEEADLIFFEWNTWHDFQDGSNVIDQAISELFEDGMIAVAPAGNLAGAKHCISLSLDEQEMVEIPFVIDETYLYQSFVAGFTWQGALNDLSITIRSAAGEELVFSSDYSQDEFSDTDIQSWKSQSPRGTSWLLLYAIAQNNVLSPGTYTFRVEASVDISELRGVLTDYSSGWGQGIAWQEYLSDVGSALSPATADQVISVGAYGGNQGGYYGAVGELRVYSGRGPRIDGVRIIDILAPDDPTVASKWGGEATGSYNVFGGTSGATPHVAGGALLLKELFPEASPQDIESLIVEGAYVEDWMDEIPADPYGYGKIDLAQAGAMEHRVAANWSDEIIEKREGKKLRLTVEGGYETEWDFGYDGSIDARDSTVLIEELDLPIVLWLKDGRGNVKRERLEPVIETGCACSSVYWNTKNIFLYSFVLGVFIVVRRREYAYSKL